MLRAREGMLIKRGAIVCFVCVVVIGALVLFFQRSFPFDQYTAVIAGSPVVVISFQPKANKVVILSIPDSVVIEGVHGYGAYSLRALWELGGIDKKSSSVLNESLQDALTIPIPWYIDRSDSSIHDPEEIVRHAFSIRTFTRVITQMARTNVPISQLLRLWWEVRTTSAERWQKIPIDEHILEQELRPDGTTVRIINRDRLDRILGDAFEDASIRREGLRVAIMNTTSVQGLAQTIGSLVSRLGMVVVRTSNGQSPVDRCQVGGVKENLESISAASIQELWGCEKRILTDEESVDLVITVGSQLEKRYQPL